MPLEYRLGTYRYVESRRDYCCKLEFNYCKIRGLISLIEYNINLEANIKKFSNPIVNIILRNNYGNIRLHSQGYISISIQFQRRPNNL